MDPQLHQDMGRIVHTVIEPQGLSERFDLGQGEADVQEPQIPEIGEDAVMLERLQDLAVGETAQPQDGAFPGEQLVFQIAGVEQGIPVPGRIPFPEPCGHGSA